MPRRGWKPPLSGRTSDCGYVAPVIVPVASDARTGADRGEVGVDVEIHEPAEAAPMTGDSYSQRTPSIIVNDGLRRQSSVTYAA